MKPARYPLQAARDLRERAVDAAEQELVAAQQHLAATKRARAAADEKVAAYARETEAHRHAETHAGVRSAAAMQHAQAFLARRHEELAQLREAATSAAEKVREAESAVLAARTALAKAEAEAKAIEKHRERWDAERKLAAEKRAEDEADDLAQRRRGE